MSVATVKENRESTPKGTRWWKGVDWCYIVVILMIIYCSILLLYVLPVFLDPGATLTGSNKLFSRVSFGNFAVLGSSQYSAYWSWVLNSLIVSSTTAVGTVLMSVAAAYAFSRFRFKGCRMTLTGLSLVQMFPQMLAFVAFFLLLLGIKDTFLALGLDSKLSPTCVYLGGVFGSNTFLPYGFFSSIPRSLDEAAMIDGATHTQTFWTVIMSLVRPVLAVVGLLSFISLLGDFVIARVVLQSPQQLMLAAGMYNWAADVRTAPWGIFAVGFVIAAVPVILLFQYLQKHIISGLTAGGVKEQVLPNPPTQPAPASSPTPVGRGRGCFTRPGVGIVWDVDIVWVEGADGREMRVVGNGCSGAAGR